MWVRFEYESTRDGGLTDPKEAMDFVKETGIDCLAVAVGTSHGAYKGEPHLEFELLKELHETIPVPLVLHGGSGTGDDNLKKAVETGIQKVNLFTDLCTAGVQSMCGYLGIDWSCMAEGKGSTELANMKANMCDAGLAAKEGYARALEHYMKLFGGEGQA